MGQLLVKRTRRIRRQIRLVIPLWFVMTIVAGFALSSDNGEEDITVISPSPMVIIAIAIIISLIMGPLTVILITFMKDLPISPHAYLTSWPHHGLGRSVSYCQAVTCTCLFGPLASCGDWHTRQRLLLCFVDDALSFGEMMMGEAKSVEKEGTEEP